MKTPSRRNTRATGAQGHSWGSSYLPGFGDRLTPDGERGGGEPQQRAHDRSLEEDGRDPGSGRDSARREPRAHGRPARAPQLPRPREGGDAEQDEP